MTDQRSKTSQASENRYGASARQRAIEAYESARDGVSGAGRKAAGALTEAPLIALAGGLAAGALIAALLPRTRTEARLVGPTARRVKDTARAAYKAAKDTGTDRLNELGLNREKGEETVRSLFQGVTDAAKASGQAALDAARNHKG
jgi:hypothetical protein